MTTDIAINIDPENLYPPVPANEHVALTGKEMFIMPKPEMSRLMPAVASLTIAIALIIGIFTAGLMIGVSR